MTAVKSCPACGGQISRQAKACPHCGHPLPHLVSSLIKVLLVVGVIFFVGFLFFSRLADDMKNVTETAGKPSPATDPVDSAIAKATKDESLDAYLTACEYCKMYAPSGNNFTTVSGESVTEGHARWVTNDYGVPNWIAVGFVDSQNELGAMRHQKWYASVVPSGEKWKLMFLKIGDEDFVNHYPSP